VDSTVVQDYIRCNLTFSGTNAPGGTAYDFEWYAQLDNAQAGVTPTTPSGGVAFGFTNGGQINIVILQNVPGANAIYLNRARAGSSNSSWILGQICPSTLITSCDFTVVAGSGNPMGTLVSFTDKDPYSRSRISDLMQAGQVYINVENSAHPTGEARGQFYQPDYQAASTTGSAAGVTASILALALPLLAMLSL